MLILPLAVSARVRLARGDLDGAWVEVETVVRLVRQYSYTSLWSAQWADPAADGLVLLWAADPHQTVATLEKAAHAWKAIPPGASPAERIRVDAALFHNTLDLPRDKLIDNLLYGQADLKRKVSAGEKLLYDVQTTPWEVARARKAFDLLAAAQIQRFETKSVPVRPASAGYAVWATAKVQLDGRPQLGFPGPGGRPNDLPLARGAERPDFHDAAPRDELDGPEVGAVGPGPDDASAPCG